MTDESLALTGTIGDDDVFGEQRIELSAGSYAILAGLDDLTGKDVRTIRTGLNSKEGDGSIVNDVNAKTLAILIRSWEITYRPGVDIPSRLKTPEAGLDMLRGVDLVRLERAAAKISKKLMNPDGESVPS